MSWPVSCVQKLNTRLVTEAARIPALTLAVGAQLGFMRGTTGVVCVDSIDGTVSADADDVANGAIEDMSLYSYALSLSQEANFVESSPYSL